MYYLAYIAMDTWSVFSLLIGFKIPHYIDEICIFHKDKDVFLVHNDVLQCDKYPLTQLTEENEWIHTGEIVPDVL